MFGASSTPGFSAGPKPASFSFGSSNNNNNTTNPGTSFGGSAGSGFSLGGSNANSTGGFGSKPTTAGFGAPTANNTNAGTSGGLFGGSGAQAAAPTSGGLFGNTSTNPGASQTTSGGLFGGSGGLNAGTGGSSLFGGSSANPSAQNTTSSFGKPALGTSTSFGGLGASSNGQNTTSGGLFGAVQPSQQAQGTAGGLFGKPAATSGGGLFGSNSGQTLGQAQPQGSTGGGLFGNNSANSGGLFGGQQQQNGAATNAQTSLFGNPNTNPNPTANINNPQPSFSWSNSQPQNPQSASSLNSFNLSAPSSAKTQSNAANYTPAVHDQVLKLKDQWDPRSAQCALKTYLYNKFSEAEIAVLLQQPKPADASPEDWEKAMVARPSPLHFPVKVTSFTEVAQRVESQLDHVAKSRVFLNSIYEKSAQISSQRDLDTTTRIARAKARHTKLSRRLLQLATTLAVLKLRGYPLLPEEEEISRQFHTLHASLSDPRGAVGSLSDLYARLAILKRRSEELSSSLESQIHSMNGGIDAVARTSNGPSETKAPTEQVVESLTKLLYKQQMGLGYLNDIVQKDVGTVEKAVKK